MIKQIVTNKPQLELVSSEIHDSELIAEIIQDLRDTAMHYANSKTGCVGLAANQIGYLQRVILVQIAGLWVPMVNPSITWVVGAKNTLQGEGCLSRPGVRRKIKRAKRIVVQYWDEDENLVEQLYKNFDARVIQHEVDHLNGVYI